VARYNKRYRKICEWIQYLLEDEELDRGTSREVNVLEKLWTYIIVDFITKLLLVAGKKRNTSSLQ